MSYLKHFIFLLLCSLRPLFSLSRSSSLYPLTLQSVSFYKRKTMLVSQAERGSTWAKQDVPLVGITSLICIGRNIYLESLIRRIQSRWIYSQVLRVNPAACHILTISFYNCSTVSQSADREGSQVCQSHSSSIILLQNDRNTTFEDVVDDVQHYFSPTFPCLFSLLTYFTTNDASTV